MKRELIVKFTIDWDEYDDVCDELVFEDLELELKTGVAVEIVKQGTQEN